MKELLWNIINSKTPDHRGLPEKELIIHVKPDNNVISSIIPFGTQINAFRIHGVINLGILVVLAEFHGLDRTKIRWTFKDSQNRILTPGIVSSKETGWRIHVKDNFKIYL